MQAIIWGNTWYSAEKELELMIKHYEQCHIEVTQRRKHDVTFENGDRWIAIRAGENAREHRANIAYIDKEVSQELIDNVIKHCTTAWPYNAFRYYCPEHEDREDLNKKYKITKVKSVHLVDNFSKEYTTTWEKEE